MGKIHDALEKAERSKELKVVPDIKPAPALRKPAASTVEVIPPAQVKSPSVQRRPETEYNRLDSKLVTYYDPGGVEAEIFKILRTNILFPKAGSPPRSIMVTSAIPGDGKSFVAANLSISIAQGIEEYVLLMDCDMRRSTIHSQFGFADNTPGLSDYLAKNVPLKSLFKKTLIDKLTILPGGRTPSNPAELLSSTAMKALLKETTARYRDRYVIVDSPPPHLTAETTALAQYIDAIILVVRYGATPKELVTSLLEKLGKEKVIGVVMNGCRIPVTERYGYGKYKKYKK
ncbi:MAG: exopolysaccharide biosynthesis protein [Proteobacteria bacterium]|nr:MAG: exopolysaccharide biosynthesis protein [Pseudomonadota bacterium]PIE69564.1 MAG: exopolysaccharide biosynthesis protein [Deltaproteobacteria bacterium]